MAELERDQEGDIVKVLKDILEELTRLRKATDRIAGR